MPDTFDPYREALVLETVTIWPDELSLSPAERERLEQELHAHPNECGHLEYVRMHTGFCRQITVTAQDLVRLGKA